MTRRLRTSLAAALLANAAAGSMANAANDDRYESISSRNAFALRDPLPLPIIRTNQPPAPAPKIVVTGLTDLGGIRKALIEISDPGKPVTRVILSEGEALGEVCVLRIDMPANRVKIRVQGTDSFVPLEAAKSPAGAVPATPGKPSAPPPMPARG